MNEKSVQDFCPFTDGKCKESCRFAYADEKYSMLKLGCKWLDLQENIEAVAKTISQRLANIESALVTLEETFLEKKSSGLVTLKRKGRK